jgi:predicted transcriptional regulator
MNSAFPVNYVWHGNNERVARAARYNPGCRISELMNLARVHYSEFQKAVYDGIVEGDGRTVPVFVITERGEQLLQRLQTRREMMA